MNIKAHQPVDTSYPSGGTFCGVGLLVALLLLATLLVVPVWQRARAIQQLREAGYHLTIAREYGRPSWHPRSWEVFNAVEVVRGQSLASRSESATRARIAAALRQLGTVPELELYGDAVTLKVLTQQRGVRRLTLRGPEVSNALLESLPSLPDLNELNLLDTRVGASGLKSLERLPNLSALSLAGTPLDEPCLESLSRLSTLKTLDLSNTGLDESLIDRYRERLPMADVTDD